ncbi:MAG TPA: ribonuclease H-like domain-containing protein [Planctomycetota bacterium]|nr:ribonuclease H-like domain-containing protein [Planctomycetota bacterium]
MRLVDKLRRIAAPAAPDALPSRAGAVLPGARVDAEEGPLWVRRIEVPVDFVHGRVRLGDLRTAAPGDLAEVARDPRLLAFDFGRTVFFDTETTSLGGGVGTYVFLLGAGWFEGASFVVEQYFLSDVTEERAFLSAINRRFAQFESAVSFHGKGFDAPRLSDRLSFHRMELRLPAVHLDLCLVGRSLYRGAFTDCRLQTFERELVGFRRSDDLPGAECPRAYFAYLQGDASLATRVFEHNLHDVLTLPAVAECFTRELAAPAHPVVRSNLGLLCESLGQDAPARAHYFAALDGLRATGHSLLSRTLERLALLERRAGRHAESARLLHERATIHPRSFQPLEDLAKYYEHRVRDLTRAEAAALEARRHLLEGGIEIDPASRARFLHALDHRLARLRRRLSP